ncbi:cAMP-dependent protein kinase [Aureococcus anophagefferens]|nr:cAMP-dependent protein kinase [Aureococcus anophagefferens]
MAALHPRRDARCLAIVRLPARRCGCAGMSTRGKLERGESEKKERRPEQILYRITDFENHETIGTGAFSRVRLVRNILEDQMRCVKIIKKLDIVSRDLLRYVRSEVALLRTVEHPFLCPSLGKYQDASSVYVVFELLRGGDLHHRLRALGTLGEPDCRFYMGQPENLVLDDAGYCRVVDLGLSKLVHFHKTLTLCGDPEYVAPEVLLRGGYGKEADCWALGVLVFELLCGYPPFYDANPLGIYQKVLKGRFDEPKELRKHGSARSFVEHLLRRDVRKRLGGSAGAGACRSHAWLSSTPWDTVLAKEAEPPFAPSLDRKRRTRGASRLAPDDVKAIDDIVNDREAEPERRPASPDKRPKTPGKDDAKAAADGDATPASSSRFNFFRRSSSKSKAGSSSSVAEPAEAKGAAAAAPPADDAKAADGGGGDAPADDADAKGGGDDAKADDDAKRDDAESDAKDAAPSPARHRNAAVVLRDAPPGAEPEPAPPRRTARREAGAE